MSPSFFLSLYKKFFTVDFDDFSDFVVKNVNVFDYEMVEVEDLEKEMSE